MKNGFFFIKSTLCLLLITTLGCSVAKHTGQEPTYKLILNDQFNGVAYDTEVWSSVAVQANPAPWNRYVVDDAQLAEVKNGHLYVRARWNATTDLPETGAIRTKDKFSFKYGKIEVRAKFTRAGQGGWPAIWLMPENTVYNGWPHGGELDIMERINTDSFVHQVVHQTNGEKRHVSNGVTAPIKVDDYNLYTVIKLPNKVEFYVNNQLTMVHQPHDAFAARWPFETDFYIILNHACADKGTSGVDFWPETVTSTKDFPYEMAVDYVKVWQLIE